MTKQLSFSHRAIALAVALTSCSCTLIAKTLRTGGEQRLTKVAPAPSRQGPHVIIFALDGAVPAQLMEAVRSGRAPHIASLLGPDKAQGMFEHAYAAPNALSVLPSSTIADWAAIFTGAPPATNGVSGDEWFDRQTATFFAPVPVSVTNITDTSKTVEDDLVGKALRVPTLYERLHVRSYVSMLSVHRGATYYTTVAPASFTDLLDRLIRGTLKGEDPERSLSAAIDRASAQKVVETIEEHGIPDLQVVYFPGIDIFTHASPNSLVSQVGYLSRVTDRAVGKVLDEYRKKGVMAHTYVMFISDHAQIPTIDDKRYELGTDDEDSPFAVVAHAGFRVRRATLILPNVDRDYQAVLAYQGFMAYVYLADRSTCSKHGERCDWTEPPRFRKDVLPVLRAFYRANRHGRPVPRLKGTIDLIFSRRPAARGEPAHPYQIFDGRNLISIHDYLMDHPRPDLADLENRMKWLSAGRYGNNAGDILLLARACTSVPIQRRFYFATISHHTWHGSACEQDSHIPFIIANPDASGADLKRLMQNFGGDSPSEKELTPLVEQLFK
jgi:hypothetical protein